MSDTNAWVVVDGRLELIDVTPLGPECLDEGHYWQFDGYASDLDDPYSCGLCHEPKWKVYRKHCEKAVSLDELNADRNRWIEAHRPAEDPWFLVRGAA